MLEGYAVKMGKNKKTAKTQSNSGKTVNKTLVKSGKQVVKSDVKSNMNRRPKWRFKKRDCDHESWGLEITEDLMSKLMDFETMTWSQILVTAKSQHHHVQTYSLCKEAQERLTHLKLDDYDEICLSVN